MKINLKIVMILVLEISIISIFLLGKFDKKIEVTRVSVTDSNEEEVFENKSEMNITSIEKIDELASTPLGNVIKIEDKYAYSLDYPTTTSIKEGDVLKTSKNEVSDIILTAILSGFPNKSYSDIGLNNELEAYQATQLAIWELSYKNNIGKGTERSYISSMREYSKSYNINPKVFDFAKEMVEFAENNTYEEGSRINVSFLDNGKINVDTREDDYRIIGPIKINIKEINLTRGKITITNSDDEEISAEILDKYGNTLFDPLMQDNEFYVKTKYQQDIKAHIEVEGHSNSAKMCYKNGYYYVIPAVVDEIVKKKILLYV